MQICLKRDIAEKLYRQSTHKQMRKHWNAN